MLAVLLLALTLAYLAALLWRGRLFTLYRLPIGPRHLRWAAGLWLGYGVSALAGLALLGRLADIAAVPREFLPVAILAGIGPGAIGLDTVLLGLGGGSVLGLVLTWWRARRGKAPWTAGDASAVMPASDAELWPAAVLAITAGVTEELFYRLFVPLVTALATGSMLAGCALGTIGFAAMHRYQGWAGVIATFIGGGLMTMLYIGSGALWLPIAAHVLTDINALVLRPALGARVRRRVSSSAATRS